MSPTEQPAASTNERAERVMGRRLTPEQEAGTVPTPIPIDYPGELGYRCPVHQDGWDELLVWSEYNGFLWCERCNRDYPSALCVPMDGESTFDKNAGPDDAVKVYLDTVEAAVRRALGTMDQ